MCQDTKRKRKKFLARSKWFWTCSIVAAGLTFGCGYLWHFQGDFTSACDRAVIEQQLAMQGAEKAEQLRQAAEDKARRAKERKEADRLAVIERQKWVHVIARTPQDLAELSNQRPKRAINVYNTDTNEYRFQAAATTRHYLTSVFKNHQMDLVVMEACGPSGWISDLCQEFGLKTLVCSTNDAAWLWKNVKRKTDKDDSLKLARMAMMGQLTPVHVPKHQVREHRSLIKYRKKLVGRINQIKNSIRGLFAGRGIEIDKGQKAWRTGRELIDSHRKPLAECSMEELWRGQLDLELTQLDSLARQQADVERRLDLIAKDDARIQRVQTIPGVGRRTAEALVTALDDVDRFDKTSTAMCVAGRLRRRSERPTRGSAMP